MSAAAGGDGSLTASQGMVVAGGMGVDAGKPVGGVGGGKRTLSLVCIATLSNGLKFGGEPAKSFKPPIVSRRARAHAWRARTVRGKPPLRTSIF
jgi:hypothetical protein